MNPSTKLLFMIGATALYLGLAILGIGGFRAFFSHPALVVLSVVYLALVVVSRFTRGNLSSGVREDRGNRWVLWAFSLIGLADGFLPALCDRLNFLTLDGEATRWAGVVLFTLGGTLRLIPVFVLGERFSGLVAIQPGHTLVTTGVYGIIRHPSYAGLLINVLGWGLAFRSLVGVLLALAFVPPLLARIKAEEALLLSQFGAEYEAYRARTWRLVPGLY